MTDRYWVLRDKVPVLATSDEWATMLQNHSNIRLVARTRPQPGVTVSTIFLGLNLQHGDGPPLLFETMIFGGPHSELQWRYPTWAAAGVHHAAVVAALREGREPPEPGE
jgi:hypothetical protein